MRYFVGYLVEGEATSYYEKLTHDLSERFSIENLSEKLPPHITFKPPFESAHSGPFTNHLESLALQQKKLPFTIEGFEKFERRKSTVYLSIKHDVAFITQGQTIVKTLADFGEKKRGFVGNFHPHISVARFLTPEKLQRVWGYLSALPEPRFESCFDNITLFRHSDGRWHIENTYRFKKDDI